MLLALRRPWARALAAAIASPALYWGQLVVLVAPISLLLADFDRRALTPRRKTAVLDPVGNATIGTAN
jgi:hypothetical protein